MLSLSTLKMQALFKVKCAKLIKPNESAVYKNYMENQIVIHENESLRTSSTDLITEKRNAKPPVFKDLQKSASFFAQPKLKSASDQALIKQHTDSSISQHVDAWKAEQEDTSCCTIL